MVSESQLFISYLERKFHRHCLHNKQSLGLFEYRKKMVAELCFTMEEGFQ